MKIAMRKTGVGRAPVTSPATPISLKRTLTPGATMIPKKAMKAAGQNTRKQVQNSKAMQNLLISKKLSLLLSFFCAVIEENLQQAV